MKISRYFYFHLLFLLIFGCENENPVRATAQFIALYALPSLQEYLPLAIFVNGKYAGSLTVVAQYEGITPNPETNKDVLVIPVESGRHTVTFYDIPKDTKPGDILEEAFPIYNILTLTVEKNTYCIQPVGASNNF